MAVDPPSATPTSVLRSALRLGDRTVPLVVGPGALASLAPTLADAGFDGRLWVVADRVALGLHGDLLARVLPGVPVLEVPGEEPHKTLRQAELIWDWLLERGAQRRDAVMAFGGGVVCDLAGFAAACYLRGIGLVNAPTTLLAQVDASVGGKTAVNHPRGKNLIGAFHQPIAVIADTTLLGTLSRRAFANGLAEVAKIAMVADAGLFERLERQAGALEPGAAALLTPIVARAIELKVAVVGRDERERGERMLLNYGHTVGHALEAATSYSRLLHGEAVAVGMEAAACIAGAMGMLGAEDASRQRRLLETLGLPTRCAGPSVEDVVARIALDKKRAGGRQRWVLAERVGVARVRDDVPEPVVTAAVAGLLEPRR